MDITPQQFRRLYHRMLEAKPREFHISDKSSDTWGIVITRRVISGVQVWHSLERKTLTLALTSDTTKSLIPHQAKPSGSTLEISKSGWLMFRWDMPYIDGKKEPSKQPNMAKVVENIRYGFEWFRENRSDI